MASLTLENIGKAFDGQMVLDGVNLQQSDGGFLVLLGPSGCGKSTLLSIIAGLIPQDRGRVLLDGRAVDHLAPAQRDVAMVFQSYALYPHMSVAENLSFGLRMRREHREEIQRRVQEAARLLGLEELLERRPSQLSGGQRQRVAMGRALVRRPALFLLDEPLSNLDARLRSRVRLELKDLHARTGHTMIYVTHDQVEAMTLGDRVAVLHRGRVRQVGAPAEIYSRPADTFVAGFIGSPEMNLLAGRVEIGRDGPAFRGADSACPWSRGLNWLRASTPCPARGPVLHCGDGQDLGSETYVHGGAGHRPGRGRA